METLRKDGGFIVPEEMAAVLRRNAKAITLCYSLLPEEQQTAIRNGAVCELCETCRICYTADKMYEAILLDGVWQDCCRTVGIAA